MVNLGVEKNFTMNQKSIIHNNKILSYKTGGEGEAVVLLHGFGEDSSVWEEMAAYLQHNYFVVTPDLPGSGASELNNDVSMEGIALVVKLIAEEEELDRFLLIGHSMGGYATLAFAEIYPQKLKGFGLFHSTALADSEEKKVTRRKGIEFIKQHGSKAFLDTIIPGLFSQRVQQGNKQLIHQFSNSFPEFSKTALIEYYEAMIKRPDRASVLKNSKVPVLFVLGEEDIVIPVDAALELSALPSVSNVHILTNSGHMGMLEEPSESKKVLDDFLVQVSVM